MSPLPLFHLRCLVSRTSSPPAVHVLSPYPCLSCANARFSSLLSRVAGPQSGEERYLRTRREVELSEEQYKLGVQVLDSLRFVHLLPPLFHESVHIPRARAHPLLSFCPGSLQLEELLSTHLPYLQHCESDRLRAAASVLKSYHAAVSDLPKVVQSSQSRVEQTLDLIRTDKDLKLLIERRRTGPFQPRPISFVSHYSEPYSTTFGIDLVKYDETNSVGAEASRSSLSGPLAQPRQGGGARFDKVPQVLVVLLNEIGKRVEIVQDPQGKCS